MMELEELNRAALRASKVAREKNPEQKRRENAERRAIVIQVLKDITEGEQATRNALEFQRYKD